MYKVFLSSTSRDLAEYRTAVRQAMAGLDGFEVVGMEDFGARNASPKEFCVQRVTESQILVGLLGHYYGSCPPSEPLSFTEIEYRTARDAGRPRLMFVAPENFPIAANLRESDASFQEQQRFRQEVMAELVAASFDKAEQLASAVTKALANWREEQREANEAVTPGLAEAPVQFAGAAKAEKPLGANPYRGLEAFRKEDAERFFGREVLVEKLWEAFIALHGSAADGETPVRLLTILGPSGCGKSSVAQAGLLAALDERPLPGRPATPSVVFTPEARPLESLAVALARQATNELSPTKKAIEFEDVLRSRAGGDGLRYLVERMLNAGGGGLILLVDQFEELYSLCDDEQERAAFIGNLLHAASEPRGHVSIVLTLRSDFLGAVNQHAKLSGLVARQNVVVPVMGEDELRRAIEEPAKAAGKEIDQSTVDLLIEQTAGREGALPLLEFVLTRIWEGFRSGVSSAETVRQVGGVGGAVARAAQELYRSLNAHEKVIAKRAFLAMVRLGEGARDTRRRASVGDIVAGGETPDDVLKVLRVFARPEQRLIALSATPEGVSTAEVTHEALFDHWTEFRGWLDQDRDQIRFARRLEADAGDWLANVRPEGMLWRPPLLDLLREYWQNKAAEMPALQLEFFDASDRQERMRQRKEAEESSRRQEAERLRLENKLEQQALRARLEEQTKLAQAHRRFTLLAAAAAVAGIVTGAAAGVSVWQARAAVVELQAASFWPRLQLWGDPLRPDDVKTLWELTRQDEKVRVAFVRQLANNRELLRQFGLRPPPIARAVGLRWPDAAREIVEQSVTHVASAQFDPNGADPFELITYTRALAALAPRVGPAVTDAAKQNIARAINGLAEEKELSGRRLWALVEAVGAFDTNLEPKTIGPARDRLREIIASADPTASAGSGDQAISRAIEVMAPVLSASERLQAVRYLVPLLGQNTDSWSAKAMPRALAALLPGLDGPEAEALSDVPAAIRRAAIDKADRDHTYLLALMQVVETLATTRNEAIAAVFGRALTTQLELPNEPLQRTALVRSAVPLLTRPGANAKVLAFYVAEDVLVPEQSRAGLDPPHRSLVRRTALTEAEAALQEALQDPEGGQKGPQPAATLKILDADWSAHPPADARPNPYRRAAQVRLLEMLAPSLNQTPTSDEPRLATDDLLAMLSGTRDYLVRGSIARALAALGSTTLTDADERPKALAAAKTALARTGSIDEASAWAGAIVALLPVDPGAATAEIVEALKDPTAAEAPTDILLAAMKTLWPKDYETIRDRTLPDPVVLQWLEAHLPAGASLSDPPSPPGL